MPKLLAWLPWFRPKPKPKRIVQVPLTGRTIRDSDFFTMSPEDFHDACGDRD